MLVFLGATLVRSTFGFGDALIAMPLLSLWLPVRSVAPLVTLVSVTSAVVMIAGDWREINAPAALKLLAGAAVGIPLGIGILNTADDTLMKSLLAALVIGFSSYSLYRPQLFRLATDRSAPLFGAAAGLLGGMYNTHGPPLVMYGLMRGYPAPRFRATLQGYFLPAGGAVLLGHAVSGLWTEPVLHGYVLSVPGVLLSLAIGRRINRALPTERFLWLVHVLLITVGCGLVLKALSVVA